ncbi:MAG TPA: LLM class F420-dependent oxidoreductase [Ilumatobacteraceae bacterium]|nr:LLM class F420-dependent oxidoreductase [Ilumatobacteraceae bacterium]
MANDLKLAMTFGYWGAAPPKNFVEIAQEAERVGFDSIWTAESWGNDVFTFLTWIGAHTKRVRLGTGIAQQAARTPTATAMAAVSVDHLTGGRLILGLGVSGPQVVEGWYGRPSDKPLARTREYVQVIRDALRREGPLTNDGPFYPLPYRGEGSVGLGKPLKIMTHPLRADIPIFLGAEGPKNVTQTAEIADGWLPLYYSPYRQEVYADQLAGAKPGFEITALATLKITENSPEAITAGLWPVRGALGFYIGGMGAKGQNYHTKLMQRMGFEEEALRVQDLFFEGKRDEAIAAVPEAFADEISLVGPPERIRDKLEAWRASPVTSLMVSSGNPADLEHIANLVL